MDKIKQLIDIHLQYPSCTMISPGHRYPRDTQGMPILGERDKIQRDPNNLITLENTISECMQTRYHHELIKTLEKGVPILYIDCGQKKEDDIMLFIFKEYSTQSQAKDKDTIVSKTIGDHTLIVPTKDERQQYIQENNPTTQEMFQHYSLLLKELLEANDENHKKMILNFEKAIGFDGIGDLMAAGGQKYLYLYLDKIQSLSKEEQQRINTFLYTRGAIGHDSYVRVKINNGNGIRKTRYSSTGHRIETPHDYSEVSIYEDKL